MMSSRRHRDMKGAESLDHYINGAEGIENRGKMIKRERERARVRVSE